MNPNVQEIQSYVSIVKDVITAVAALTAAIVAVIGLWAWKGQLKGKTEYELAQRVLRAVYKVRDAMYFVRHPMIDQGEYAQAMKDAGIEVYSPDAAVPLRIDTEVYHKRWTKVQEAWADLDANMLEAEALWGRESRDVFRPLRQCISTLFASIQMFLDGRTRPSIASDTERLERIRLVIYGLPDDEDGNSFSAETIKAVGEIEAFLKPHLKL